MRTRTHYGIRVLCGPGVPLGDHQMLCQAPRLVVPDRELARPLVKQGAGAELDHHGQEQDGDDPAEQP